jgi:hypothetical protein
LIFRSQAVSEFRRKEGPRLPSVVTVIRAIRGLLLVSFGAVALFGEPSSRWRIESDTPLAVPGGVAQDIRWASDTQLFVAEGQNGVTVRESSAPAAVARIAVRPARKGTGFFASRLAASSSALVMASPLNAAWWRPRTKDSAIRPPIAIGMIMDVDLRGDTLLLLGGDTNDQGGAPNGIASIGSLTRNFEDRKVLMAGPGGPAGKELVRCHLFEPGSARFLSDGSALVVPGLQPGAFLYDRNGKLLRTWQLDDLDVFDRCRISDEQMIEMAADFARRTEWINRFTTVEDILPLDEGPALLLRTYRNGATTWDMALLRADGSVVREPLPIRSPSPRAHIRGDVRARRVALLVFDYELPGKAPLPPRVILMRR